MYIYSNHHRIDYCAHVNIETGIKDCGSNNDTSNIFSKRSQQSFIVGFCLKEAQASYSGLNSFTLCTRVGILFTRPHHLIERGYLGQ
jgi:hypothetical protein